MIKHGRRIARLVAGGILVGLGVALSIPGVPGPGVALVILGLSILSADFGFARRIMEEIKSRGRRAIARGDGPSTVPCRAGSAEWG